MKKTSKLIAGFLLTAMLLSLCSCGNTGAASSSQPPQGVQSSTVSQSSAISRFPAVSAPVEPEGDGFSAEFPEELKQYACPWVLDAPAKAVAEGTINYYFMSSNGMVMSATEDDPTKWGDSCLIVFPDGQTMLIDAGMAAYAPVLVENLKRLGVKKLDHLVFSHPHGDHEFGATMREVNIFTEFEISKCYRNGAYCGAWKEERQHLLETTCQNAGVPLITLKAGDTMEFGGVKLEVLWPEDGMEGQILRTTEDVNNSSLVMRFDYKEHSSLFVGDLYRRGEMKVMELCGDKLDVDLLKVPHHGSTTSSHKEFIEVVSPEIAVATGYQLRNTIMSRYKKAGAEFLCDRTKGYIWVTSDGEQMTRETKQDRAEG